ncbi:MAG TPA: HAMP domain-containing sensor histidine kinase [Pirellulales bacterium]|jgi:signal transduction histidine kinase|nr:HAMP domain-containing sensor histidine kinase [Pirellulales bacterium]
MTQAATIFEPLPLDGSADLQTVLAAWHGATVRLEQTHEALRSEVQRLTQELEVKNRELARKNRLADLGQMASHIAHEVRNSLVPVTLYLSLLRRSISADEGNRELVDKIAAGFTALDATVSDLLNFTADRDPQRQPFAIRELLEDIVGSLAPQFAAQGIQSRLDAATGQVVVADRDMIRRAILNLLLNALDVMPEGGQLVVKASTSPSDLSIEVADSGPGLSPEARQRAFEPFFTTKSNGTGLGLAIVERIAAAHGGEISSSESPLGGAAFALRIPFRRQEAT